MKLTMTRVLTPLAALAIAFGAQGALPADEGFEGGALDAAWTFEPGADSAPDASAITAYGTDATPTARPSQFANDGDNYLKLSTEDGILFRNVNGGSSMSAGTGLYLDTVVQFTVTDSGDRPNPTAEDKFIIWLDVDSTQNATNLCVYGGEYTLTSDNTIGLAANPKVYKLTNGAVDIQPGSWHRLTVKAVADMGLTLDSESPYTMPAVPAFQVYIDGNLMTADEILFDDSSLKSECTDESLVTDKKFIPAMVGGGNLTKVGFSGEGKLDDVVITQAMPDVEPHDTVTITWDTSKATSITPRIGTAPVGTFTGGSATFIVAAGSTVTIAAEDMVAASGYNEAYFDLSGSTCAFDGFDADAGAVTVEFGEDGETATIELDIGYSLSYDVTVNWSALNEAILAGNVVSIAIGGETITATGVEGDTVLEDGEYTVPGVVPGGSFAVTVTYANDVQLTTQLAVAGGLTLNGNTVAIPADFAVEEPTLTVTISAAAPAAKLFAIGDDQYTMAELAAAIADDGITTSQDQPLKLLDDVELEAGFTIDADTMQWIDLAGNKLTGPEEAALATVNGTLNIVDSVGGGAVEAGTYGSIAAVGATGVLNITAGDYTGSFAVTSDGVIYITGGTFDADVAGATFPAGHGLAQNKAGKYEYGAVTYTITFNKNGGEGTDMADQTYTIESAAFQLTANAYTYEGKTFAGWALSADGEVVYADGATIPQGTTGDKALFAIWEDASGKELAPGEQDDTEYSDEDSAKAAASGITIAPTQAVADVLTADGALAAYTAKFEVKAVEKDGKWYNEVALTAAAAEDLQEQVNGDVASAAVTEKLAAAADAAQTVTVDATPGFYYSVKYGATLSTMTEGDRVLATGSTVTLTLPKGADAGFYSILVNIGPKVAE